MRISLAKHAAPHLDADGRCQCGKPCCVQGLTGDCRCYDCTCRQVPNAGFGLDDTNPYTGAYAAGGYLPGAQIH